MLADESAFLLPQKFKRFGPETWFKSIKSVERGKLITIADLSELISKLP